MPIRKGMLGVALALAIVPTQSALAAPTADPFKTPVPTPEQAAAHTKLFTEAAGKFPPPAKPVPTVSPSEARQKLDGARAATERTLATNPKQAAAGISAGVQSLEKPGDTKSASDVQTASTTGGTPVWPTCYRVSEAPRPCDINTYSRPGGTPLRGVMIINASGGWDSSPQTVDYIGALHGQGWANAGFDTYVVEHTQRSATGAGYPSGVTATINALQWFDLIRSTYPSNRICMRGFSSGGHLSLLIAANRKTAPSGLNCVITEASPTNITTAGTLSSPSLELVAGWAFGHDPYIREVYSPVAHMFPNQGLIPAASDDPVVPQTHADWAVQPGWRPGLHKYIVPDLICNPADNAGQTVYLFGHPCSGDGIVASTAFTYFTKQLNMANYGTP